jgi:hypothetical protein
MTQTGMHPLSTCPAPALRFDLDGCVDESPIIFQVLSHYWPGSMLDVDRTCCIDLV